MPHLNTGVRGMLHAHLDVVVPTKLDAAQTVALRDFQALSATGPPLSTHRWPRHRAGSSHACATRSRPADLMGAPLFWVESVPSAGAEVLVSGPEGRHAVTVVRVRPGEIIRIGDGRGSVADCEVTEVAGRTNCGRRSVRSPSPTGRVRR